MQILNNHVEIQKSPRVEYRMWIKFILRLIIIFLLMRD